MDEFVHDGTRVAYDDVGPRDGPALLFVHGWTADRHRWDAQVEHFSAHHRCVRLDLPGHGDSEPSARAPSLPGLLACVSGLADHLGLARLTVVGHSMGGMVALLLALEQPGRVERVVLVDSVARMLFGRARTVLFGLSRLLPFRPFVAVNTRRAFGGRVPRAVVRQYTARALTTPRGVVRGYYAAMGGFDVLDRLPGITCPVLWVHGLRDVQFPLSQAVRAAAAMPHAMIRVIDTGHEAPLEDPGAVTRAIDDVLPDRGRDDGRAAAGRVETLSRPGDEGAARR